MTNEWSATMIIDEIDRLSVAYDKAKEYISKITSGIEQQMDTWQSRQKIIRDQIIQSKSSSTSSYDFLLPKTQRINELTLEAVEALCRADLLIEQIVRIDIKSRIIPASTRSFDTDKLLNRTHQSSPPVIRQQQSSFNGKFNGQPRMPIPVLRTQQQTSSTRSPQERSSFKPVTTRQQPSPSNVENISRPSSIYPQNNYYTGTERVNSSRPSYGTRTPVSDQMTSPYVAPSTNQMASNYQSRQQPRTKEKVTLQRVPPGTRWKKAKIEIVDSLSGFYVQNLDDKVLDQFQQMETELREYYNDLEKSNQLIPSENIAIGDFGVAKYSEDKQWCRARLITSEEYDQIKIVYIDYGNIELKSMNEFFPIHKLFTELPAQAIACSLSQAFPRIQTEDGVLWSEETIEIFKDEVMDKIVEVHFADPEDGTKQWPLHFVRIIVDNQSVTNILSLKQRIEPKPNYFIAEQMAPSLSQQEYILFNVPITEDDSEQ